MAPPTLKALASLKGIGKRGAEMIIAQLQDHVGEFMGGEVEVATTAPQDERMIAWSRAQLDAITILVEWGDSRMEAERLLSLVHRSEPAISEPADLVRAAYRLKSASPG